MKRVTLLLPLLAACGSVELMEPGEPVDPPGPAEAKVIVFRPADRNSLRAYAFYDGMELMGFLQSESRIEILRSPGKHLFYLRGVTDSAVEAELEAGRTYVLRAASEPTWFRLQLVLAPVPPSEDPESTELEEELAACRLLKPNLPAVEPYIRENWDDVSKRLEWYAWEGRDETARLHKEDGR